MVSVRRDIIIGKTFASVLSLALKSPGKTFEIQSRNKATADVHGMLVSLVVLSIEVNTTGCIYSPTWALDVARSTVLGNFQDALRADE